MGEVFLAEDPRLGRRVALKRLTLKGAGIEEQLQRLMQEGTAAAALNHPNIAAIYDVLEADGVAHIVMEYVAGETLAAKLLRGPLSLDRILQIGIQLCDGLATAHTHHIVHRDLKPSNAIVTPDGQVKILDFGLAERRGGAPAPGDMTISAGTLAHALQPIAGTPAYMSPEQLLGKKTDQRTDIYSLGVTLYQLATGHTPFEGDSFMSVALSILTGPRPDVKELGPGLGPIVARALERDPPDRYQSAREMRHDLQALATLAAETPTLPGEAVHVAPGPVTRQERRVFAWVATFVLIVMLGFVVWWGIGRHASVQAGGLPVVAVLPLDTSSSDAGDHTLGLGVSDALVADLAASRDLLVVPSRTEDGRTPVRDVGKVARSLGATFVVDGSVQLVGEEVRLNVRVMRPDGVAMRGLVEEGRRADLLELQRRLSSALIEAVGGTTANRVRTNRQPATAVGSLETYSQARALLDHRDVGDNLQQAITLLKHCVAADPSFALAHAALAEGFWAEYQATKDTHFVEQAQQAAERAAALAPSQPSSQFALALIYRGTGQLDRAADQLRRSIAERPEQDSTHRLLGEILAEQGDTAAAIAMLQQAIVLRPAYPANYTSLGLVHLRSGHYTEAIAPLAEAVRLDPRSPELHTRLGAAYQYLGRDRDAIAEYRQATQHGGNAIAYSNLALLQYRAGRYPEAAEGYAQSNRLRPNDPVTLRNLGDAYRKLGRDTDARNAYEEGLAITGRMLSVNQEDPRALQTRGILLAKLGRSKEAVAAADAAIRIAPADTDVLYERAVVLLIAGDKTGALAALERAVTAGYPAAEAGRDDEWTPVASDRGFRTIVGGH